VIPCGIILYLAVIKHSDMKKFFRFLPAILLLIGMVMFPGCGEDSSINIFSIQDDMALGQQADQQIRSDPQTFQILDSTQYPTAYQHLYRIRNIILASGKLTYADTFGWRCTILKNDTVVNAFCLPGGTMYFYTGLIKLLDNEAQFAGVMAHEMVHADRRHSTDQLTIAYGLDILLSIALGNDPNAIAQIAADLAAGLSSLAFSRQDEYEADEYAVKYLYPTEEDAASLADFFIMLENQPSPPTFLSTHPSPEDRVQKINDHFQALGGVHGGTFVTRYNEFKSSLP
jgi:predicted Zn-dependent protease